MSTLSWIVLGGVLMSAIAMVGTVTLVLKPVVLERLLLPLVAFAAGSLIGGAFFHMIPAALAGGMDATDAGVAIVTGFTVFFVLEQVLHWHHCHLANSDCRQPLPFPVLIGDALHNFLGGLAIAGTFLIDVRLAEAARVRLRPRPADGRGLDLSGRRTSTLVPGGRATRRRRA